MGMARRRVLIVDDSKTAQVRLRKMLERFDVEVDTVLSAEEALGYLSYRHPAAVFLDHHMEGMDGLEALKIIKSNPSTALIPVIMYTSEQGDVYVGQARALGAIDILGKGAMKHGNLEKVLGSLGIFARGPEVELGSSHDAQPATELPEEPNRAKAVLTSFDDTDASESVDTPSKDLEQVQRQISRLSKFISLRCVKKLKTAQSFY
jgi:CheY-like chemotaxis protein